MSQALPLALFIIQEAIKAAPELAAELSELLAKPEPTDQDWDQFRQRVSARTYRSFVPDTKIPPG